MLNKNHQLVYRTDGRRAGNSRGLVMIDQKYYKVDDIIQSLSAEVFRKENHFSQGPTVTFDNTPVIIHSFDGGPGVPIIGQIKTGEHWSACQWSSKGACIDGNQNHQLISNQ